MDEHISWLRGLAYIGRTVLKQIFKVHSDYCKTRLEIDLFILRLKKHARDHGPAAT
jgi:hypothetical protein